MGMKPPEEIKKALECYSLRDKYPVCLFYGEDWCSACKNAAALAMIWRLEAQVPKWISVEESMPDEFVPVLGHIIDAGNFPHVRECYRVGNAFYFPALRDIHTISHWMPLPEPPKEEEK